MPEAEFLTDLNTALRQDLPPNVLLTHAPMDVDICTTATAPLCRDSYMNVLKAQEDLIDFIMPQYYNGVGTKNFLVYFYIQFTHFFCPAQLGQTQMVQSL